MTQARERSLAVVVCVLGAVLLLLVASRTWVEVVVVEPGFPRIVVEGTGRSLAGSSAAVGLVGLAGALALLATGRVGRRVTGAVLLLGGLGTAWQCIDVGRDLAAAVAPAVATAVGREGVDPTTVDSSVWPWLGVVGGLVLAAGGLLAVVRGGRWPAPTRRYDAGPARAGDLPAAGASGDAASADDLWTAQDRGEDPTADGAEGPADPDGGASRS